MLVIGDVMTDIVVRPEGPLARGSDRRASIRFEPGGSAANQAAWLARFGARGRLRRARRRGRRRGGAARLKAAGVTPHLVGRPERPTGRLVALIDPDGERSFFTDRGANEALDGRRHPRRAGRARRPHPPLRLFVLRPLAARGGARRHAPRRRRRRSASIRPRRNSCARSGPTPSSPGREARAPPAERRGSRGPRRLGRSRDPMRAARRALSARRHQARRGRVRRGGRRAALARRGARGRRDRHDRRRRRLRRRLSRRTAPGARDSSRARAAPSPPGATAATMVGGRPRTSSVHRN